MLLLNYEHLPLPGPYQSRHAIYVREYADPSMAAVSVLYIVLTAVLLTFATVFLGLGKVLNVEAPR